ncbi:hypothetical protein KBY58_02825 [Cyanobium sp. HWJ4-Hawea]|uniref:hypothetical protein n=1 Tax=Cyanobium sp. HWJ4-Hawea TaxID=2823713 RepID=UPI0020CD6CB7|nr:hypothetical protein [Cyanobium sp. HWJ4-Hawea]MCP9808365.1 hypothetical protein [Cyanobium sp. HWJ4-Hawea]
MTSHTTARKPGFILDPRPGEEDLQALSILELAALPPEGSRAQFGPICGCRQSNKNRLGGQRPMLRWLPDGSALKAWCGNCGKALRGGVHRQRLATHVLGLTRLPLDHLDLEDAVLAGLMLPEHLERPTPLPD